MVKLPLFAGCAPDEIKGILEDSQGKIRQFDAGEVMLHECTPAVSMAAVVSGVVFVRECGLSDDTRHLVQRLYAGGTFGATFPAFTPKTSPGMLLAEEPSEVLFLNVAAIRRMMEKGAHPRFLANLYAAACMQGFYAWRKLMLLSCYEIGDRVLLYLKWRKEDGLAGPARFRYGELAEYLGVNRTALYRAIAKLRKSGKIRIEDDTLALA
ncbi:MAG: Crp/Fnr family transcriptional regulator [bacterium]|nr:Crp/Fnr family transcriptional regulator [Candidatus Colisoma equi]